MPSAEPFDSLSIPDPSSESLQEENWRDEVASRVSSYRARRKGSRGAENLPELDFGPTANAQTPDSANFVGLGSRNHEAPKAGRNAFDTNYYRRLNAESMGYGPELLMGAAVEADSDPGAGSEVADGVADDAGKAVVNDGAASDAALNEVAGFATVDITTVDAAPVDAAPREAIHQDTAPQESIPQDAIPQTKELELHPALADDSVLDRYYIVAGEPEAEVAAAGPALPPSAQPVQGNLIVFPRPLLEPPLLPKPSGDELAEPMNRRPRILEVPEDIMPAVQGSLFPEIRLDADVPENQGVREPEIEVPLQVAPLSQRLLASLADLGVVLAAGALFAGIAWRALPEVPHAKPFWMILGAVTMLLWAVYQHLFLLYGGRTVGMSLKGIHLSTFDGQAPRWKQRSRRARFMCISFASVALGFLWALVDEDALCWHDRISQTFPTME